MSLSYKMRGLDEFIKHAMKQKQEVKSAVDFEIGQAALRVERRAKILAPVDTGWLRTQIYNEKQRMMHYKVISPALYSVYLELGTRYMSAQPYLDPALRAEWPVLMANLKKMFRR
ncbi:hypothetical protein BKX95_00280 [Streptococcus iniae]|nr:hypothetical protein BKX95_00280 [Streptococcus iniae]